ncbi:acylphosphatase [Mumia flava]|uniref:Acylphosphatase n=1 Tax=Mumia flava TaxID=1348852 RepID=A0A0B2BPA5_9ACTN|nr:acylphosphatase [Mumia flava]PJJ56991.1 acylphosphatase [Mumia flava]
MADRAVRVVVSGHVQGVFFRDSCRRAALEAGVRGWVRNRDDGAVEAVFAGPPDAVDALVAWARVGPPRARVDDVAVARADDPGGTGFDVVG